MNQIVKTSDGSDTIFVPELNEHYHSIHGAIQESQHIFIDSGLRFCTASPVSIFELGFGTGLNAFLTAINSIETCRTVNYTSIEKFPLSPETALELNYSKFFEDEYKNIFAHLHLAPWDRSTEVGNYFTINKIKGDISTDQSPGKYDLIYFDAFGPDKQPGLWTREIFEYISSITVTNGILVTYSAKGEVKRNLRACGFEVFLLPGPPGKRQIIRAVKK